MALTNTNNFQKAGIKSELTNIDDSESGSDDDELPLSRLVNIRNTLGESGSHWRKLLLVVTETRSDNDIVSSLLNKDTDGKNSERDDVPTNADGLLALDTVCRTLKMYDIVDDIFFSRKYIYQKTKPVYHSRFLC